jgi:hypothetical protein
MNMRPKNGTGVDLNMKSVQIIAIGFVIIITLIIGQLIFPYQNFSFFSTSNDNNTSEKWIDVTIPVKPEILGLLLNIYSVKIHAIEPNVPASLPVIKGTLKEGDTFFIENGSVLTEKNNVPSEEEAPILAQQVLSQYGGLPDDAEFFNSYTSYLKKYNGSTGELIEKWPTHTSVSYTRNIDGMPVVGQTDKIFVALGENGNVLSVYKVWRSLEYSGNITHIITVSDAIEKIRNREIISPPSSIRIEIDNITLGYYEKSRQDPEIMLEPVWIFSGRTPTNEPISLFVYAGDSE